MERRYEAVYVFDSTLEDAAIADRLTRYAGLLGNPGDISLDHWGRRQLAYKIGTRDTGYYVVSRFTIDPTVLPEFERALKLDEGMMRYLLTIYELFSGEPREAIEARFAGKGYAALKRELAELVAERLRPLQERYREVREAPDYLDGVLARGAECAAAEGAHVLGAVKAAMGLG